MELMNDEIPIVERGQFVSPVDAVFEPYTWGDYLAHLVPAKRKQFEGFQKIVNEGKLFREKDVTFNCFIKKEKMVSMTVNGCGFDRPRMISGCSKWTKYIAALWFYNYGCALKLVWHIDNWIWYCSGALTDDFNRWITITIKVTPGTILYFFTDFSKYDVTQGLLAITREVAWYRKLGFARNVPYGEVILQSKLQGMCRAKQMLFSRPGTRKSGDLDTSSGNSKITGEAIGLFFKIHALKTAQGWQSWAMTISVLLP
jgi:hypothetical protein